MNFDKFVEQFHGMIDVLSDKMEESEIPHEARDIIYIDLLEKILKKLNTERFLDRIFLEIEPKNEELYTAVSYKNIDGTIQYDLEMIPMEPGHNTYVFRGVRRCPWAQYRDRIESKYLPTMTEAQSWIDTQMEQNKQRILKR